ncbi:unnamed protein product, partial [Didymodactylos carnosus]
MSLGSLNYPNSVNKPIFLNNIGQRINYNDIVVPNTIIYVDDPLKDVEKKETRREIGDEPQDLVEVTEEPISMNIIKFEVAPFNSNNDSICEQTPAKKDDTDSVKPKVERQERLKHYFKKWRGLKEQRPKRLSWHECVWSWTGA